MERRILENDALPLDEQANTRELAEEFGISQGKMIAEVDMARIKMRRKMFDRGLEGTEDFAPAPDLDTNDTIEKQTIRENLKDGRYNADVLPQRISQEASRSEDGRTILAATNVARRSHGAIQQDYDEFSDGPRSHAITSAQKIGRQVRQLEDDALAAWAREEGCSSAGRSQGCSWPGGSSKVSGAGLSLWLRSTTRPSDGRRLTTSSCTPISWSSCTGCHFIISCSLMLPFVWRVCVPERSGVQ